MRKSVTTCFFRSYLLIINRESRVLRLFIPTFFPTYFQLFLPMRLELVGWNVNFTSLLIDPVDEGRYSYGNVKLKFM